MKPSGSPPSDYSRTRHSGNGQTSHSRILPPCGTVPKCPLTFSLVDLSLSKCRGSNGRSHLHGRLGDAPLQTQDVVQVRRGWFCHLALWRSPPGDLPPLPQQSTPLHSIDHGKGVGRQCHLPWCPVGEEWNYSHDLCIPQKDTHWQVPELQITIPYQGTQRSRAVLEGQSREGMRWQGIHHLWQVFRASGYPDPVVKRNLRGRPTATNTTVESETPPKLLLLPYVRGFSEQIEKMCRPLGVRTVMKSTSTLRSSIVKVKQARPDMKEEGCCRARVPMCVYWRPRKNLGETSKQAQDSSEEEWPQETAHLGKPASGQLWRCFSQASGQTLSEEKGLEALHIQQQLPTSHLDCGLHCTPTPLGSPCCSSPTSPCLPVSPKGDDSLPWRASLCLQRADNPPWQADSMSAVGHIYLLRGKW